jgi:hypothetical protein
MAHRVLIIKDGSIVRDALMSELLQGHKNLEEAFLKTLEVDGHE